MTGRQLPLVPAAPPIFKDSAMPLSAIKYSGGLTPDASFVESIKKFGVLSPIHVRKYRKAYQIVDGRRRYAAAITVGLRTIPAREIMTDGWNSHDVLSLAMNAQRSTNYAQAAEVVERLVGKGATLHEIYAATGISAATVKKLMGLAKLHSALRAAFYDGKIAPTVAGRVAKLPAAQQERLAKVYARERALTGSDVHAVKEVTHGAAADALADLIPTIVEVEYAWRPATKSKLAEAKALLPKGHKAVKFIEEAAAALK